MRGEAHCQPAGWREPVQSGQLSCHLLGLPPGGGEGSDRDLTSSRHDPSWHGLSWPPGQGPWRTTVPHFIFVPPPSRSKRGVKPWGPQGPRSKGGVRSALSTSQSPVPSFPSPPSPGSGSGAPGPEGPFQGCLLRPCLWRGATEAWQAALRIVRLSCVPAKRLLVLDAEWPSSPPPGRPEGTPTAAQGHSVGA